MRNTILLLLYVTFTLFHSSALPATTDGSIKPGIIAHVNAYGVINHDIQPLATTQNPDIVTGEQRHFSIRQMHFEHITKQIPALLGTRFGFSCELYSEELDGNVPITLVITHPEMQLPDGRTLTEQRMTIQALFRNGYANRGSAYRLDKDYEVVTGSWTFSYYINGKRILAQSFELVSPGQTERSGASE